MNVLIIEDEELAVRKLRKQIADVDNRPTAYGAVFMQDRPPTRP